MAKRTTYEQNSKKNDLTEAGYLGVPESTGKTGPYSSCLVTVILHSHLIGNNLKLWIRLNPTSRFLLQLIYACTVLA